jgi:hypothetical protein
MDVYDQKSHHGRVDRNIRRHFWFFRLKNTTVVGIERGKKHSLMCLGDGRLLCSARKARTVSKNCKHLSLFVLSPASRIGGMSTLTQNPT